MNRRDFIKAGAALVGAAASPATASESVWPEFVRESAGSVLPGVGLDLSETALEDAIVAIERMTDANGVPIACSPRYLVLVPNETAPISVARSIVNAIAELREKCSFAPEIVACVEPSLRHYEWAMMAADGRTVLTNDAGGPRYKVRHVYGRHLDMLERAR